MAKPGDKVKHYEILEPIGKGGMGEVFLAQDTILDRRVAIKFLPKSLQKDEKARVRLLREAKAAAALDHPFICKIYETGEIGGKACIVMEYIEGEDLKEKLNEGTPPLRDSLQMTLEIAEALEKAHEKGIVHRDLKPSNIMLTLQDHVKVMDFGLAKQILPGGDEESLTKTLTQASVTEQGAIVGTLAYMSPEQARGDMIDARSDIFSLGIILYELASGKHPFTKPSAIETLSSILRDATPPISVKPKTVNPLLTPILRKALAKEPGDRYQTIKDLIIDIRKVLRDTVGGARFLYRGFPIIAGTIVVIAMLLTGIWWFVLRGKVSPTEVVTEPISVLIADFQNQTNDPVFDGALEYAMSIGLEGAPFITTYQRPRARRVVNQLNPNAEGKLDAEMARLVCVREGINMFIEGVIEPKDDGYILKIWGRDPTNPEKVTEYSKTIPSKADVLLAAAWLANKVISDLGGTPAESAQALAGETFTTSSLEAMNAYTKAQELNKQGKLEEAISEYLRAIDADVNFGRAYSGLALVYQNRGQYEEAEKYFQEALARIDRMSEREKYQIMTIYHLINRNFQKAIEECSELVRLYPADFSGQTNLAVAYYYARNYSKAKEAGLRAVELYPKKILPRFNLSWYALADGDLEMAEQQTQEVLSINVEYDEVYVVIALLKLAQGLIDEAAKTYETLKTLTPEGESLAALGLADIALYEGRLSDAAEILETRINLDREEQRTEYSGNKMSLLAYAQLLSGKRSLAIRNADKVAASIKAAGPLFLSAQIYIQTGQESKARSIAEELSKRLVSEPKAYAKLIEGEIVMKQGEISEAVGLFQEAQIILDTWLGRFALGRALLELEAYPDAHSELGVCLNRRGEATSIFFDGVPSYHVLPPIYYYLGRAQEGLGSAAASESYQKFLEIKGKEDWGDPLVKDAQKRLDNLGAR